MIPLSDSLGNKSRPTCRASPLGPISLRLFELDMLLDDFPTPPISLALRLKFALFIGALGGGIVGVVIIRGGDVGIESSPGESSSSSFSSVGGCRGGVSKGESNVSAGGIMRGFEESGVSWIREEEATHYIYYSQTHSQTSPLLIPRPLPSSFPDLSPPHSQTSPLLIPRPLPSSFPDLSPPHSQTSPLLIPRPLPSSFPDLSPPHFQTSPLLIPRPLPSSFPDLSPPHTQTSPLLIPRPLPSSFPDLSPPVIP